MAVLLKFRKYRRSVLFPRIGVSEFAGFVLYLCRDLNCLITGSKLWYFCNSCNVIFSNFDGELCRVGHEVQKLDLLCVLNHLFVVLINLFYQLIFLFHLKGKRLFCGVVVLFYFLQYYSLSSVNMELV